MSTVRHLAGWAALVALLLAATLLPFLPGRYDVLAVTLSYMAQSAGAAGFLLLVPVGIVWSIAELRQRFRRRRGLPARDLRRPFAVVSLVAATLVALIASFPAFNSGLSLGLLCLALWARVVVRLAPQRPLPDHSPAWFNPAPLYLFLVPLIVLILQRALVPGAVRFSRDHAIRHSAALISDIEAYRATNGHYPSSLLSVWTDYEPNLMGVPRYYYEPSGSAYNLYFEQFTVALDTREIVMYNPLDQHVMTSHDMDLLQFAPEELEPRRGWYAMGESGHPHWKHFLFD